MKIQEITNEPLSIAKIVTLKNGEKITIRPLFSTDVQGFGTFLENLSEETNKRFQPHSLTKQGAQNVCSQIDYKKMLRLIGINEKNEVIAYFLLSFSFPEDEKKRYQTYEIELIEHNDCRIAPVVSDAYQNEGVGSSMMQFSLELTKLLEIRHVILWGGSQATNQRAIHFYEKFGFKKMGEFEKHDMNNYDMLYSLS